MSQSRREPDSGRSLAIPNRPQVPAAPHAALPERPIVEHYRKRAKELLAALRGGDPEVARRFAQHGRPRTESSAGADGARGAEATTTRARPTLTDAQRVVAREHGFTSWSRFKRAIEARAAAARNQGGWQIVRTAAAEGRVAQEPVRPRLDCALRELVEVVAVGETVRVGDTTVSLLSLERYDDGFVAQFRLLHEYGRGDGDDDLAVLSTAMPELRVSATDDQGHRYDVWPHGGGGGGGRGLLSWRYAFRFAPAVPPAARAVTLAVEAIEWRRMDPETRRLVPASEVVGPWTFTVGLGRAG